MIPRTGLNTLTKRKIPALAKNQLHIVQTIVSHLTGRMQKKETTRSERNLKTP
jgi:hypothetical protein